MQKVFKNSRQSFKKSYNFWKKYPSWKISTIYALENMIHFMYIPKQKLGNMIHSRAKTHLASRSDLFLMACCNLSQGWAHLTMNTWLDLQHLSDYHWLLSILKYTDLWLHELNDQLLALKVLGIYTRPEISIPFNPSHYLLSFWWRENNKCLTFFTIFGLKQASRLSNIFKT